MHGPTLWDEWTSAIRHMDNTGHRLHDWSLSPPLPTAGPSQGHELSSGSPEFAPKVESSECLENSKWAETHLQEERESPQHC